MPSLTGPLYALLATAIMLLAVTADAHASDPRRVNIHVWRMALGDKNTYYDMMDHTTDNPKKHRVEAVRQHRLDILARPPALEGELPNDDDAAEAEAVPADEMIIVLLAILVLMALWIAAWRPRATAVS
jgi:hypothetical protein